MQGNVCGGSVGHSNTSFLTNVFRPRVVGCESKVNTYSNLLRSHQMPFFSRSAFKTSLKPSVQNVVARTSRRLKSGISESQKQTSTSSRAHVSKKADEASKTLLQGLDYMGTGLFAFTGTLKAILLAKMDVLGCVIVGFTTAVGGGTVRDLFLGATPVFWMKETEYVVLAVVSSLATFFFYPSFRGSQRLDQKLNKTEEEILNWADAIALGAFACVGGECYNPIFLLCLFKFTDPYFLFSHQC